MSSPAGETYLDALFEASPIGMAVFDSSLRYVRINRALAEMNGVAAAEHIGRTMREVIPELAPTADPILRRALTSSEGIHRIPVSGETRAQPGVERHWIASWLPIEVRGERGVAFFVEERTEQVAAERALRASELRFRGMSEAAPLGIFLTDVDGNVVYSNPAAQRMLGRSAEELQGDGWTRVVHVDDQEALFRRGEEGGEGWGPLRGPPVARMRGAIRGARGVGGAGAHAGPRAGARPDSRAAGGRTEVAGHPT